MTKSKKVLAAKMACILSVVPALIYAHEYGPPAASTTAPGDVSRTGCIQATCHVGTLNPAGGSVQIITATSDSYVPGQTQALTIKISDSAQKAWGYQVTARDPSGNQAGDFNASDKLSQVVCLDDSIKAAGKLCSSQFPAQYGEQSLTGYTASKGTSGSYSYQINWTAPSTDVGPVTFYATANASVGNLDQRAGHIYSATLKVSPAAAGGVKPTINTSGGVVNNATSLASGIAPNTYITIFGSNLATNTRTWAGSDFGASGSTLPTSLDGTSVKINGKDAYVEYISPTQINAITPADTATGSGIAVSVTSGGKTSDVASVTLNSVAPGFFTFLGKYVAAADAVTNAFIGKAGLFDGTPADFTTPAKPGQIVTLYGTGFGSTSPAITPGIVTDKIYNLSPTPVITVGGTPATVSFAALTPGFAQVYQFNITIPANAPDGDLKISAQTQGVSSQDDSTCCFITVKK